jgi:hypothetical protein
MQVNAIRRGKRQHIGKTIPTKTKPLAELNQKRTEIVDVVGKHREAFLPRASNEASALSFKAKWD